jgi:hypothetical protein
MGGMKAATLALLFSVLSSVSMAAGTKATWKIRVYEGPVAEPAALLETWDFVGEKDAQGDLLQLSSGIWQLPVRAPGAGALNLKGRVSGSATEILCDSATLRLQLWDTSGLAETSPRYKAFFQSDARLKAGQSTTMAFTIGDASQADAFARYLIVVSLEGLASPP